MAEIREAVQLHKEYGLQWIANRYDKLKITLSRRNELIGKTLLAACLSAGLSTPAHCAEICTLVADAKTGHMLHQSGPGCDTPYSPASTFKLALAFMGFETGILKAPDVPAVPYDPATDAYYKIWRQTHTPETWLKHSVIWYSQFLTKDMGKEQFQAFVDGFDYGNRDLSGDPGENNGLTRAWLSSSLQITPIQQLAFLHKIAGQALPVSSETQQSVRATVQVFEAAGNWKLQGKTGTSFVLGANGTRTKSQTGWFIGWAEKADQKVVFVRLTHETNPQKTVASQRTKSSVLAQLDHWVVGQ